MKIYFRNGKTIRISKNMGIKLIDLIFTNSDQSDFVREFGGNEKSTALFRLADIIAIK